VRYAITHRTTYHYADAVDVANHILHLTPRETDRQRVLSAAIRIDPEEIGLHDETDAFGNRATFLTIERQHRVFSAILRAEVEVAPFAPPAATPAWEAVAADVGAAAAADPHGIFDYALPSPRVRPLPAARTYAEPSFPARRPVFDAVRELTRRIRQDFTYDPDATDVATPVATVLRDRRGVCQDFAQVQIAALRAMGLAARYVSGYLRSSDVAAQPEGPDADLRGADASHAWVSVWCGEGGWIDFDPTNDLVVSDGHAVLAWGRDYTDVSPVRGILLGGGPHDLDVAVRMRRLDA
jgi:transglutaminase-like putative cysteine protease